MQRPDILKVGDVVRSSVKLLGNPAGTIGFVYETYDLGDGPAASIIFQNGNYDGFSPNEQIMFLDRDFYMHVYLLSNYHFQNVFFLDKQFREGLFRPVFCDAEIMKHGCQSE